MLLVYTHENNILVSNARNLLAENGIESLLKNEFAGGGAGDLPVFDTWPEIWVTDEDYVKAKEILEALEEPVEGVKWLCDSCGEVNEPAFQSCWNCQSEKT